MADVANDFELDSDDVNSIDNEMPPPKSKRKKGKKWTFLESYEDGAKAEEFISLFKEGGLLEKAKKKKTKRAMAKIFITVIRAVISIGGSQSLLTTTLWKRLDHTRTWLTLIKKEEFKKPKKN